MKIILALISLGFMASCSSQMFDGRFDFSEVLRSPSGSSEKESVIQVEASPVVEEAAPDEEKTWEESIEPRSWWGTL